MLFELHAKICACTKEDHDVIALKKLVESQKVEVANQGESHLFFTSDHICHFMRLPIPRTFNQSLHDDELPFVLGLSLSSATGPKMLAPA